jgi:orotate phosphoribosyltransferase
VIEDVITTGGSALKAVTAIRNAGGLIAGVLALVDREEGGREAIEAVGVPVVSLVTASDLLPLIPTE